MIFCRYVDAAFARRYAATLPMLRAMPAGVTPPLLMFRCRALMLPLIFSISRASRYAMMMLDAALKQRRGFKDAARAMRVAATMRAR